MSKKLKYLLIVFCALVFVVLFVLFSRTDNAWLKNANVNLSEYHPYVIGTEIEFNKGGNSADYISKELGWGGQETKWRCTVGKESVVKLYVKDGQGTPLVLNVYAAGVFDYKKDQNQQVTVFANGNEIGVWKVRDNTKYSLNIPASVMTDNILTLKFVIDKPYVSAVDSRPLGMAVREIVIRKPVANKLKKKVGKWLKNKLNNNA